MVEILWHHFKDRSFRSIKKFGRLAKYQGYRIYFPVSTCAKMILIFINMNPGSMLYMS